MLIVERMRVLGFQQYLLPAVFNFFQNIFKFLKKMKLLILFACLILFYDSPLNKIKHTLPIMWSSGFCLLFCFHLAISHILYGKWSQFQ